MEAGRFQFLRKFSPALRCICHCEERSNLKIKLSELSQSQDAAAIRARIKNGFSFEGIQKDHQFLVLKTK
ncbi:hypothetical protein RCH13_001606 [Chryseobacterium sp. MP_3.2]|nr:hypothetical protein [Chryseobacterium sp. MP_3.2]